MAVPVASAEGGGGPCSALPRYGGSPETLAGLVEPDGMTADRDHALGAVDSAVALGAGLVGGDVAGLVILPPGIRNIGNIWGSIRNIRGRIRNCGGAIRNNRSTRRLKMLGCFGCFACFACRR